MILNILAIGYVELLILVSPSKMLFPRKIESGNHVDTLCGHRFSVEGVTLVESAESS